MQSPSHRALVWGNYALALGLVNAGAGLFIRSMVYVGQEADAGLLGQVAGLGMLLFGAVFLGAGIHHQRRTPVRWYVQLLPILLGLVLYAVIA